MKVKKVFENLNEYYIKIDRLPEDIYPLNRENYQKILDLFPKLNNMLGSHYNLIKKDKDWNGSLSIFSTIDEWYYAEVYDIEVHLDKSSLWGRYQLVNPHYFRCDQWDGLIKFVKKEFIGNEN